MGASFVDRMLSVDFGVMVSKLVGMCKAFTVASDMAFTIFWVFVIVSSMRIPRGIVFTVMFFRESFIIRAFVRNSSIIFIRIAGAVSKNSRVAGSMVLAGVIFSIRFGRAAVMIIVAAYGKNFMVIAIDEGVFIRNAVCAIRFIVCKVFNTVFIDPVINIGRYH